MFESGQLFYLSASSENVSLPFPLLHPRQPPCTSAFPEPRFLSSHRPPLSSPAFFPSRANNPRPLFSPCFSLLPPFPPVSTLRLYCLLHFPLSPPSIPHRLAYLSRFFLPFSPLHSHSSSVCFASLVFPSNSPRSRSGLRSTSRQNGTVAVLRIQTAVSHSSPPRES